MSFLDDFEALWIETRNPLYVWRAFAEECPPGDPLPDWIERYLRDSGDRLLGLADNSPPADAVKMTASALRLTRRGANAFEDWSAVRKAATAAALYDARAGKGDAKLALLAQSAGVGPRTMARWISRARQLWAAQRR